MRIVNNKKMKSLLLCMMLIVAMAFATVGCNTKKESGAEESTAVVAETVENGIEDSAATVEETVESEVEVLGEGETMFLFTVVDKDGNETNYEIYTDKETVGEALLDLELIAGEDGDFGLYVKTVNGITVDYDVDQTYWAFYVNGEYAMSGVDTTEVEEGALYAFKVGK